MKISAVIPVFNTEPKYLRQSVEGVLNQTRKVDEIILVNDGSFRDNTLSEIGCIFYDYYPKIILMNQKNKKISGALNTGIRTMKGDWWAGCSSDDRWLPNKIKEQVRFIENNPEIRVLYSDWQHISPSGIILDDYKEPEFKDRLEAGNHIIREYFGNWSGLMIHKSVFDDIGLFNESYPTREDYEFAIRILTKYMMYRVPKVLFQYRLHAQQITNSRDFGSGTAEGKKYCEMARALAIKHFGNEDDKREFYNGKNRF